MSEQNAGAATQSVADVLIEEGLAGDGEPGGSQNNDFQAADGSQNDDQALLDALQGENPAGDGESGESQTDDNGSESLTLNAVAEKLGVDVADLYNLEIQMPDNGESMKLSELKDLATEHTRGNMERLAWETEATKQRNELANGRQELQQMLGMIPAQMRTPEMLQRARQELAQSKEIETRALLDRVPEWRDPKVFEADQPVILEHIEQFGFGADDWGGLLDHRLQAYVRHNAMRERRIAELLQQAKGKRGSRASTGTGSGKPGSVNQTSQRSGNARSNKVGQIAGLITKG